MNAPLHLGRRRQYLLPVKRGRRKQLLTLLAIVSALQLPQAIPCNGSRTTTPTCGKTVVLTKVGPPGPILGAGAAGFFFYDVNLFARGASFLPAPNCPQPVSAEVDITLHCDPGPDSNGSSGPVAIGSGYTDISVPVVVQNGPPRECRVSATATVTFSDGSVVTAVCDASQGGRGPSVCIVSPIAPGTPRLDIERLTAPVLAVHAGDIGIHSYRIKNNDPAERFRGRLSVGSKNTSTIPEDTTGSGDVFGVSDPAGDAFGVYFADQIPDGVCPPLPPNPHLQIFREVRRQINLAPGQEIFVDLMHRPYGGCATGSCSESRVRLAGNFSDNTPGLACTNAAVVVDNAIPPNIGACPGIGSIGQVAAVDPAAKIANFQILVDPTLPLGSHLPLQIRGGVNGFQGLQVQTNLLQEDNNESVRDVTTLSDPTGGLLPPGAVLRGQLSLQIFDPTSFNEIQLQRLELVGGAPTGLSHLAPVVHAHLSTFPVGPAGSPQSEVEGFIQYGALGFPAGTGNPLPLPIRVAPDPFGNVGVRIELPGSNGPLIERVELLCDIRFYGFATDPNPPLPFQGHLVQPLGLGQLDVDHATGHLVVSNIGSSGQDGVTIDLGDSDFGTRIDFPLPIPLDPAGTQIRLQGFGLIEGNPNEQPLGDVRLIGPGSEPFLLFGDFTPFGAQNILAQVFANGRVVGTAILPPSGQLGTLGPIAPGFGLPNLGGCGKFAPGLPYPLPCFFWEFDRLGEFTFPGRGPMIGDRVALFASGSPAQLDQVTALNLQAARVPMGALVVSNIGSSGLDGVSQDPESAADKLRRENLEKRPPDVAGHDLQIFGHSHGATGQARLSDIGGQLVVSNIGSSGLDGVSIDLGADDTFQALLLPAVNLRMPGTRFEASAVGAIGGIPGKPLGFFGCQNNNGTVQAVADYKDLGIQDVQVQLLLGGVPQATLSIPCGVIGTVQPGPAGGFPQIRSCGKRPPFGPPCFFIETDRAIFFTPTGGAGAGGRVLCDRVEALAVGLPEPLTGLEQFILRGTNLGVLGIGGESAPAQILVGSVSPQQATTGEILTITGAGFADDVDNLCIVTMMPGNQVAIPLEVLTTSDTTLRARVGAIPPNIQGTGQLMIARGEGKRGFFEPAFPDINVEDPVWVWEFTGLETPNGVPFTPIPTPPPATTVWFEQPEVVDGELCLRFEDPDNPGRPFSWPDPCKVQINARLRDHSDSFGFDQFASCLRFTNATTPAECARRLCDSIRCAWFQQAGIWVNCHVEVDQSGIPSVYIGFADGVHKVDWGTFSVCITGINQPVITEVSPTTGTTGDIVTIHGRGFGDCPDNLCVIAMVGDRSIGVEVLGARDDRIIGRLGVVPPPGAAGQADGQIMVGRGKGKRGFFEPIFPDIVQDERVWVWDFNGGETITGAPFTPTFTPPPPDDLWFFSQQPQDGKLCLTIPRFDWDPGCKISISARMRDHASSRGHDHYSACIRFPEAGSFEDCIARICDTIRCSWTQLAGVQVVCDVDFTPNDATICIGFAPPFRVDWGNLDVCIDCPDPPPAPPVIEAVDRTTATTGDVLRITGAGFGDNPDDLCVLQMDGSQSRPFFVDSFFDVFLDLNLRQDVITAPLGALPRDAQPGPIMVDVGVGRKAPVIPLFPEVSFTKDHWAWKNDPRVPGFQGPPLTPVPSEPGLGEKWFFSEPPTDGVMCLYIDGDWGTRSKVTISGRLRDHSTGKGYDQFSSGVMIDGPMPALDCARRICDVLTCTWSQLAGVRVLCIAEPFGNDGAKITLLFENGSIDWGNITLCVTNLDQLTTYDQWKLIHGVIDDLEDLDFDGIPAIVEAYLGLNPDRADSFEAETDPLGIVRYQRDPTIAGLIAVLETSTNLLEFRVAAVNPPGDLFGKISVLFPDLGERGFWRFGVRRW